MTDFGKLFVFEGPDNVGKTSLSHGVASRLATASVDCKWFSFPGNEDGTLGKHIHTIHHHAGHAEICQISPASLQLLHIAAHIDAIESRILPALENGQHIILDRFWWSTVVYGTAGGVDAGALNVMIHLEELFWGAIQPAIVFLVRRNTPPSRRTLESSFLVKEYGKLAAKEAKKYPVKIFDNDGTVDEAIERILQNQEFSSLMSFPPKKTEARSLSAEEAFQNRANVSKAFLPHTKLLPAKTTIVYDTYWRFAAERQSIFFRRLNNEPQPWTLDPILREYKFTNVYRASDRTSQYLIRNIINVEPLTAEEIFFRIMLFKTFNRISTWELLTRSFGRVSYRDYSFARYDEVLSKAINAGQRIYSAAYIMPSGGSRSTGRKHSMHLKLIEQMLTDELPKRLTDASSMAKAFELLRAYPTIGDFLAYQYITDLNYSTLLDFNEMTFVMPGPGAQDGIRKCFSDLGGLNGAEIIKLMADNQEAEFERLGLKFQSLWGRPLQLIDCQNIFCEVDKYARLKHPEFSGVTGRTRIKQKYRITPERIDFCFPDKWGLNDRIAKGSLNVASV